MPTTISLAYANFAPQLTYAARATDAEATRHSLSGVCVTIHAGQLAFVATDGRRLHVANLAPLDLPDADLCMLDAKTVKQLLKGKAAITVTLDDNGLGSVTCGDSVVSTPLSEMRFPQWRLVLVDDPTATHIANVGNFLKMAEDCLGKETVWSLVDGRPALTRSVYIPEAMLAILPPRFSVDMRFVRDAVDIPKAGKLGRKRSCQFAYRTTGGNTCYTFTVGGYHAVVMGCKIS